MKKTFMLNIDDDNIAKYLDDDSVTFELNNMKINVPLEGLKQAIIEIEAFKQWSKSSKEEKTNSIKVL